METKIIKPCCPTCRSEDVSLIGGILVGTQGVPLNDHVILEDLVATQPTITNELLYCNQCNKHVLLHDAKRAAGLPVAAYLWEHNAVGNKIPIVCPKCANSTAFIRSVLVRGRGEQEVTISEGEVEDVVDENIVVDDTVVLAYLCDMDECEGEIQLRDEDDYTLSRNPGS